METKINKNTMKNTKGLNRTMQYGNSWVICEIIKKKIKFKSYYVVWKPTKPASAVPAPTGLNRTMQYGNRQKQGQKRPKASV